MSIYGLLLTGAIGKDKGNGYRFYDALNKATERDLVDALRYLEARGRYTTGYSSRRIAAIKRRIIEVAAPANGVVTP